ncbi:bile acid:sodium symporter family protein [Petroclostridium sp. X23]|uniref:bile acid:sodium symporter family protein n=1 Tax=Petroclostridium sp. X23 TaxID=3045146 RepID=UPI0024ACC7F6|nr:bile acid:sodium symporter family protein [Petroclostridium sp. X23]WHH58797.1 bile acid:sodium symporter family protein [Petroclostridium sp. X23]
MNIIKNISTIMGRYFAVIVIIALGIGLFKPEQFEWVMPHISLLLGVIMLGMGMTIKAEDFKIIFLRPGEVILGCAAQFTIMPLLAYAISLIFKLPQELAVGFVLLGACPGGTASNVITYFAKGDVALSVGMTSVSTLISPIVTPVITLLLAHQWVDVPAKDMFLSIFNTILIPIMIGIIVKKLLKDTTEKVLEVFPIISVLSVTLIVGAVVGASAEKIFDTAPVVFAGVILHNCMGLLLGFFIGKLFHVSEAKRRAISIELGMQNSGLAASLASNYFDPNTAVPAALFSVWHNISGPGLASYWSKKVLEE